jgi:alkanesulfonate monooxygenase SsuD/methylene tetrahydromethanopterin reductase-like flavin-dependent oxidoreductase (luciferase family)
MKVGVALPQYDYSIAGQKPLAFETIVGCATLAARSGAESVWLSDHLFLDLGKYGGASTREMCFDPIVTLAALARRVPDVRLGTLVLLEALRPAAILAKSLATLDRIAAGRLDVGIGAGWYGPEYEAIGMQMPPPRERLDRLTDALGVVCDLIGDGTRNNPPAWQQPRPRVFVGGKGDRLLRIAARHADGWNTCWTWTPEAYAERVHVLDDECARINRDPNTVWRTLGLYALCGENEADLQRRFDRLRECSPAGVLDGVELEQFREGRLVGTVEQVREQLATWNELGVETLIIGAGVVPFQLGALDDLELLLELAAPT